MRRMEPPVLLSSVQDPIQGRHICFELPCLLLESSASGGGELVELGPAPRFAEAPPGAHELSLLEPVERLIERRAFDRDGTIGTVANELGDRIAVHRLPRQRI